MSSPPIATNGLCFQTVYKVSYLEFRAHIPSPWNNSEVGRQDPKLAHRCQDIVELPLQLDILEAGGLLKL